MSEKDFLAQLASQLKPISQKVLIPELEVSNADTSQKKAEFFLSKLESMKITSSKKFDKVRSKQRTLYRLPNNATLVADHLSSKIRFVSGIEPLEELFDEMKDKNTLTDQIQSVSKNFEFQKLIKSSETMQFERLWQIKAAAVSKEGKESPPVLCRTVGAYRHFVHDIPVLGAASVSIKLTGKQTVDALALNTSATSGKSLGTEKLINPDEGVKRIYRQLVALHRQSKTPVFETTVAQSIQFGYLNISKRSQQNFLVPAVVAVLDVNDPDFPQGYVLVAPATDNAKLAVQISADASPRAARRK